MPTLPAQMTRNGQLVTVKTAADYWNMYWAGYRPTGVAVAPDPSDPFSDAAVAALVRSIVSETSAALRATFALKGEVVTGGGGGGGGTPVATLADPDLYTFNEASLTADPSDPDLYLFA